MAYRDKFKEGKIKVPVAADTIINEGDYVCFNATGGAVPGDDAASLLFAGIATKGADNDGGSLGDVEVEIVVAGLFELSRLTDDVGLESAITLALEIQGDMENHYSSGTRHTTGQQSTASFDALPCTTLAELLTLTGAMLTAYAAHNADAIKASDWAYHSEQAANRALASAVAPTTLAEAVTKLNDLKAKYNNHEDETTGHNSTPSVVADQVAADDAALGASLAVGDNGKTVYITGAQEFHTTADNNVILGKLLKVVTATSGWVDIGRI